jgi:hypothetical protein
MGIKECGGNQGQEASSPPSFKRGFPLRTGLAVRTHRTHGNFRTKIFQKGKLVPEGHAFATQNFLLRLLC